MKINSAYSRHKILSLFLLCLFSVSYGQQQVAKETLGTEYFKKGNYEKALPVFAKLAQSYPDNAMYNYYYGVCLIKNNLFETAAKEALLNAVVDKTPSNSNFYLALYFHAIGDWDEAKSFYQRFSKAGSTQEKRSLQFDHYVDMCNSKINPFHPVTDTGSKIFSDTLIKSAPKVDEKQFPIPEELKKSWFNFQINEDLGYHSIEDFRSEAAKVLFTKAWIAKALNDSILAAADSMRKEHERVNRVDTRLGLVQMIVDCEQKSFQLLRDREKYLDQSRVKESAYWEKEGKKAALAFNAMIQERENKQNFLKNPELQEKQQQADTLSNEPPAPSPPKPVVPTIKAVENLIYKIQIGSFKNGVLTPTFKTLFTKMSKLRKIDKFTDPKKYVIYTVGSFVNYSDATKMKEQLMIEGVKGAFVVAYKNGKKIAVLEALKLQGIKPESTQKSK